MKSWRAPEQAWRPRRTLHLPRERGAWRQADSLASDARRRRWRRAIAFVLAVAVTAPMVSTTVAYVTGLAEALATERAQAAVLVDSLQQVRAALDLRVERDFDVRRVSDSRPPLPIMGRVTSGFSNRRLHPLLQLWRAHRGVDIPAATGTAIRPVVPGRVIEVGRDFGFGRFVLLRHGKVTTRYAHLQRTLVTEGEWLTPDRVLGTVGSTGLASSPHLHYEVLLRNQPVDPLRHEIRVMEIVPATIRREATPKPPTLR